MEGIRLWPNPFRDRVVLEGKTAFKNAVFIIYDASGREVMRVEGVNGDRVELNLNGVGAGLFNLRVRAEYRDWGNLLLIRQ